MTEDQCSPQEVVDRGEAIYQKQIRAQVEGGNKGKFVVIDIKSGDYEVDTEDIDASLRLLARHPDAVIYGLRIGHRAAYKLGCRFQPEVE